MNQESTAGKPVHKKATDVLIEGIIARIEGGDEVLAQRIFGTLRIDGVTHPTVEDVLGVLRARREKKSSAEK